jgi:hypothetical protein
VVDPKWLGPARDSAINRPGLPVHLAANGDLIATQSQSSSRARRRDLNAEVRMSARLAPEDTFIALGDAAAIVLWRLARRAVA